MSSKKTLAFACLERDDAQGLGSLLAEWPQWEEKGVREGSHGPESLLMAAIPKSPACARLLAREVRAAEPALGAPWALGPLAKAVAGGDAELVALLAPKTALAPRRTERESFLGLAAARPDGACLDALLAAGADPRAPDGGLITPLMRAIISGSAVNAKKLIPLSCLDALNRNERTALMLAVEFARVEIAQALAPLSDLDKKAPSSASGRLRWVTALDLALIKAQTHGTASVNDRAAIADAIAVASISAEHPSRGRLDKAKKAIALLGAGNLPRAAAAFEARALRIAVNRSSRKKPAAQAEKIAQADLAPARSVDAGQPSGGKAVARKAARL